MFKTLFAVLIACSYLGSYLTKINFWVLFCFFSVCLAYAMVGRHKKDISADREEFNLPRTESEKERLDELIRRGNVLVEYLSKHDYPTNVIANRVKRNWETLKETQMIGITPDDTDTPGFVLNKNDAMQLCLTVEPGAAGAIDDINTATFVLIHEMSHLGAIEYQHGTEFVNVFKKLLRASIDVGIWEYTDYSQNPITYCKYYVNATPRVPEKFANIVTASTEILHDPLLYTHPE